MLVGIIFTWAGEAETRLDSLEMAFDKLSWLKMGVEVLSHGEILSP